MAKFTVKDRPSGLINGEEWPEVGGVIDLPEVVGDGMPELERAKAEKPKVEKPKVEKRPASKAGVETRETKKS